MMVMVLASIGLPGTNGFAGEVMVLLGFFQRAWGEAQSPPQWFPQLAVLSALALSGVILGAWYMLWMSERVVFGPATTAGVFPMRTSDVRQARLTGRPAPTRPNSLDPRPSLGAPSPG